RCSPARPRVVLWLMPPTVPDRRALDSAERTLCGQIPRFSALWTRWWASGLVERHVVGQLELAARELLDVDVLERQHAHTRDEAVRAVDVPDPDVPHRELEVEVVLRVVTDDVD